MSWLFGRKKHHRESPPDTPGEAAPGQSDDYILIEKQENPLSPNFERSGGLYPNLGDRSAINPPPLPSIVPQQQIPPGDSQNYLLGIPFKLCKSFNNDFEIERLRVDEIMSFVLSVQNEHYDYDFSLERSVVNEMASGAE